VRKILRKLAIGTGRQGSGWLTLLLLLAVLVPSVCLLWFMSRAVRNEKSAVREELMEFSRDRLASERGLMETNWEHVSPAMADAIIRFDNSGKVEFPKLLSHGGTALTDAQGRLLQPSAELRALETNRDATSPIFAGLIRELNDYSNAMPAPQRRFLMHRMMTIFPNKVKFPTLPAEDLAAQYLETEPRPPIEPKLRATALPDVWQCGSDDGRGLMLFRTATLQAEVPTNFALVPPAKDTSKYLLAVPAGPRLPDWQLAMALRDPRLFEATARDQSAFYLWTGFLVLTLVAVLALLAAGLIRRQAAVAQLRNDLLATVSHELKTPLSSMRLLVETLLNTEPMHEPTTRQYLELIARENVRLSRLIDNFLTFSRIERNKYAFDFKEVPAGAIAESAASAARERFAAAGCKFGVIVPDALPTITVDSDAMVTALLNLLDNAFKYSGDEKQIVLLAGAENGNVTFAVQDNGIGLTPRETKRIFKRFYQVDQRLARTGGGCGLGLSIVQFIVTAHRGTVEVESEPGSGSIFRITIPK
jgi:signal transduction histidine kinase